MVTRICLYRDVWIAAIASSRTSLATLSVVMCNTSLAPFVNLPHVPLDPYPKWATIQIRHELERIDLLSRQTADKINYENQLELGKRRRVDNRLYQFTI